MSSGWEIRLASDHLVMVGAGKYEEAKAIISRRWPDSVVLSHRQLLDEEVRKLSLAEGQIVEGANAHRT